MYIYIHIYIYIYIYIYTYTCIYPCVNQEILIIYSLMESILLYTTSHDTYACHVCMRCVTWMSESCHVYGCDVYRCVACRRSHVTCDCMVYARKGHHILI